MKEAVAYSVLTASFLIENNKNLILFLRLMNSAKTIEIRGNEDAGRVLLKAGIEDMEKKIK